MPPFDQRMMDGMHLQNLFGIGFGAELFYSFVVIVCSFMIYFGTKEIYELSSYKGIKYFRQSFLFFAVAFFVRSFIKFVVMYFGVNGIIEFSPTIFRATGMLTQLAFMYFSSMALFYLVYSIMSRKWENHANKIYLFHILAVFIAFVSVLSRDPFVYLGLNLFLIIIVIFALASANTKEKEKKRINLRQIYFLLTIFWALNIIDALIPRFFQGFQLFVYLASTGVFLLILYKVIKKTGSN